MKLQEIDQTIVQFVKNIRIFWQLLFLLGIISYGLSFLYHISNRPLVRQLENFSTIDLSFFSMALVFALAIFMNKRKYFSHRALRIHAQKIAQENPLFDQVQLTKAVTKNLAKSIKSIWVMGLILILLGVIYYWWTFVAKNMHIYFIVGLWSLMMNYPRKDLFMDLPYIIEMTYKDLNKE